MSEKVDYRDMLIKYIEHVGRCEGTAHLHRIDEPWSAYDSELFTVEEWKELMSLEKEGRKRFKS